MLALLTQREAAKLLRTSERHLERLRIAGTGPKFMRLGKHKNIRYRPADVDAWLASKVVGSTSEESDQGEAA
jgi:excisionase family DNA binding protein